VFLAIGPSLLAIASVQQKRKSSGSKARCLEVISRIPRPWPGPGSEPPDWNKVPEFGPWQICDDVLVRVVYQPGGRLKGNRAMARPCKTIDPKRVIRYSADSFGLPVFLLPGQETGAAFAATSTASRFQVARFYPLIPKSTH
jgi:hypothetical protein